MKTNIEIAVRAAIVMAILVAAKAPAQELDRDGWNVTVAPYLWGAAMDGTAQIKGRSTAVDLSRSDILDHMDIGGMGTVVARKGEWGVLADAAWVELSGSSTMPPADVFPTLGVFTVQGVRRISPYVDVTFGARWTHLNGRVELGAPFNLEVEKSRDWVDPTVGVVLHAPLTGRVHASLMADVGGFGVGSDFAWQVFPTAGVDITRHASVELGWRILDENYATGDGADRFEYDMRLQGPAAGLAFRF